MSAQMNPRASLPVLMTMTPAALDEVMAIEEATYAFPWTRGNFLDSLHAGYPAWVLRAEDGLMLGYYVAMMGVDEMHLLNITVRPECQGRGHALQMLEALRESTRERGVDTLWLEVRTSNVRARAIYERYGFRQVGLRRGYYPAADGRREDAIVMSLKP